MSAARVLPCATHHLRTFLVSLVLIVLCLAGFLFGVEMEAVTPAKGVITAKDLREARTLLGGLVEPGWYEGETAEGVRVRMDAQGDGRVDPAAGASAAVQGREWLRDAGKVPVRGMSFHRLQPGDELWPGQPLATVRADGLRFRLQEIDDQIKERESRGEPSAGLNRERDRVRDQLTQAVLHVPDGADNWLVLEVRAAPQQAVSPGDVIATLVPLDPQTRQPRDLLARLEVEEKHWGSLAPGQTVRLRSAVHSHRLHGEAEARIERLEPWGAPADNGACRFHALAPVTAAPFALPIGSSFHAEVVIGRKRVYRIILEH
jgi:hypothetical protein